MSAPSFDPEKLYEALDRRRRRKEMRWRDVAKAAGVSPSTLTRISQGKRPDADSLVRLMAWLGSFDIRRFAEGAGLDLGMQGIGQLIGGPLGINIMSAPTPPPRVIVVRDPRRPA